MKKFIFNFFAGLLLCGILFIGTSCTKATVVSYCNYKLRQPSLTIGGKTLRDGDVFSFVCTQEMSDSGCGGGKGETQTIKAVLADEEYSIDIEIVSGKCGSCRAGSPKFSMADVTLAD